MSRPSTTPPPCSATQARWRATSSAKPFSVLLFDEIEKAHPRILDKFLQILEDGRLTDGKGVTAYFSETIIIFTSNIGASEIGIGAEGSDLEKEFRHKVKEHFNKELRRPELLNRIGENIVVFKPVDSEEFRREIIKKKLVPLQDRSNPSTM
jgi:ATP-dependent Clp protease ATP-binding subunit ClpA